jgi:hypothetical protein
VKKELNPTPWFNSFFTESIFKNNSPLELFLKILSVKKELNPTPWFNSFFTESIFKNNSPPLELFLKILSVKKEFNLACRTPPPHKF